MNLKLIDVVSGFKKFCIVTCRIIEACEKFWRSGGLASATCRYSATLNFFESFFYDAEPFINFSFIVDAGRKSHGEKN